MHATCLLILVCSKTETNISIPLHTNGISELATILLGQTHLAICQVSFILTDITVAIYSVVGIVELRTSA